MRVATYVALALTVALAMFPRRSDTASLHHHNHLVAADDDEDFRPIQLYHDYGLIRRSASADDAFDDYGHLRFGRSDA